MFDKQSTPLRGVAIYSASTRLAELAARIGFEMVWIEMEHGSAPDFDHVESLCIATENGGAIPVVRVPDAQRHHILRALEAGANVLVVPMVNDAATARQIVEHGKYPPLGKRGYNTRTRAVNFGLDPVPLAFERANQSTHLFAQIETSEAIENLEAICQVEGLSGVFIGPGDLSSDLGRTGEFNHPDVVEVVSDCIRRAKAKQTYVGIFASPGALLDAAIKAGCDFAICGGDVIELCTIWPQLLARTEKQA